MPLSITAFGDGDIVARDFANLPPQRLRSPISGRYVAVGLLEQSFIRSMSQRPAGPGGADVG